MPSEHSKGDVGAWGGEIGLTSVRANGDRGWGRRQHSQRPGRPIRVCVCGGGVARARARSRSRVIFPDPGASLDQYENSFFTIQEENSSQPNEGQQTARLAL